VLLAQVLGTVVSTRKDPGLLGLKLLLTRELDGTFKPTGN
jgi:microcompartment protein CcmK/EutM